MSRKAGGDCGIRLAAQMGVLRILGDVTLELITEAVGLLHDGHLTCHPEGSAQPGIAVFGQLGLATECARLAGSKVHPAELQELPIMAETAQIASVGQDGQCIDWPDPGNGCQQLVVVVGLEQFDSAVLDLVALGNQTAPFTQTQTEHSDSVGVLRNWQANRGFGGLINICKQTFF